MRGSSALSAAQPIQPPFVLLGHFLDFPRPDLVRSRRGYINVDAQGRIAGIGDGPPPGSVAAPMLSWSGWVLPGLIDLHHHWPQRPIIGADGMPLLDWLERVVFPAEAAFADAQKAYQVAKDYALEMARYGTTTAVGFSSSHLDAAEAVVQACLEVGLAAVLGPALMDRGCPPELQVPADQALGFLASFAPRTAQRSGGRIQVSINPRFAICCSDRLMRGAAELAERLKLVIHTHLAENVIECAMSCKLDPQAQDYTDIYARAGLLTPRTLLAHALHLSPRELHAIREVDATLVHCPTANVFLESGTLPLMTRWAHHQHLGLGSDVGAGTTASMPRTAVSALETAKHRKLANLDPAGTPLPTATQLWWLMTAGNAQALGQGEQIGRLDVGYRADLLLVHRPPLAEQLEREDALCRLLYQWSADSVAHTLVGGRTVTLAPSAAAAT